MSFLLVLILFYYFQLLSRKFIIICLLLISITSTVLHLSEQSSMIITRKTLFYPFIFVPDFIFSSHMIQQLVSLYFFFFFTMNYFGGLTKFFALSWMDSKLHASCRIDALMNL